MDHYSFTDPWGMDGWVVHVGWPIADGLATKWLLIQLAVWRRIGKVRRPRPAFLTTMLRRQLILYTPATAFTDCMLVLVYHSCVYKCFVFLCCAYMNVCCVLFVYSGNSDGLFTGIGYITGILSGKLCVVLCCIIYFADLALDSSWPVKFTQYSEWS